MSWRSSAWRLASAPAFRDRAAEEPNHPREVVEAALAHIAQNEVEVAYARSDLFERRQLTDNCSAYVVGGTGSAAG